MSWKTKGKGKDHTHFKVMSNKGDEKMPTKEQYGFNPNEFSLPDGTRVLKEGDKFIEYDGNEVKRRFIGIDRDTLQEEGIRDIYRLKVHGKVVFLVDERDLKEKTKKKEESI